MPAMIKRLKSVTVNIVAGANVATAVLMWLVGFADYANPIDHPYLANAGLLFPVFLLANLLFLFFWLTFRWRLTIIPIMGYAAAFVPLRIYLPINSMPSPPDDAIKVMSYNVECFTPDDGSVDDMKEKVTEYMKSCDADIVCLQECNGVGNGAYSPMDSLYKHNSVDIIGDNGSNAVGVFSRFPIIKKEKIDYASSGNGSWAYFLKVRDDTVVVISNHFESTHLSLDERERYKDMIKGEMSKDTARAESRRLLQRLGESSKIRAPQANAVHSYIELHSGYPIIICGDFNDNPISYSRRIVAKGLTDCYVNSACGLGFSLNKKGFFVRIDNILCSSHFKPYGCKVDKSITVSDHYPIFCWLERMPKMPK